MVVSWNAPFSDRSAYIRRLGPIGPDRRRVVMGQTTLASLLLKDAHPKSRRHADVCAVVRLQHEGPCSVGRNLCMSFPQQPFIYIYHIYIVHSSLYVFILYSLYIINEVEQINP